METTDSGDPWIYWGLWSRKDIERVSQLLSSLGVRFYQTEFESTEDILREWCAWDDSSANPKLGFDLWIHEEDKSKVGYRIVEMFPERTFGYKK